MTRCDASEEPKDEKDKTWFLRCWREYDESFGEAEASVKLCEQLSGATNVDVIDLLRQSGRLAAGAIKASAESRELLQRASALARDAVKMASIQASQIAARRASQIRSIYGGQDELILRELMPKYSDEYVPAVDYLLDLGKRIQENDTCCIADDEYCSIRDKLHSAVDFVREYEIKAQEIDNRIRSERHELRNNTWGALLWAFAGLLLGFALDWLFSCITSM